VAKLKGCWIFWAGRVVMWVGERRVRWDDRERQRDKSLYERDFMVIG